jgi:hypothetical protein
VLPQDLEHWIDTATAARIDHKAANVPITDRRPLLLRALVDLYKDRPQKERV